MSKKSKSNFLMQGTILAVASLVSRVIGLLYRIPVTNIIGDMGNSFYSCAFEIYSIVLLISSYSLPLAVSKLVSARVQKGERRNAYRVLKGSIIFALCSGTAAGILIYFCAGFFTRVMKTPLSIYALKVLAPIFVVVAVLGVLRGFFQGLGSMIPSAISQIIEQIINAIMSVWGAYTLYHYGEKIGGVLGNKNLYGAAYGAAGSTFGTGMGAVAALVFMFVLFMSYKKVFFDLMKNDRSRKKEPYRQIFALLIMTIIPVLMSTAIYNISSTIDQGIYKNMALWRGMEDMDVDISWGIFSVRYKTIINVPLAFASAMASSCVPSLTAAFLQKDRRLVNRRINLSIRFIMIITFPCAVGIAVIPGPILQLLGLYEKTGMAAQMLRVGAISIVFYSLSTLSNALLQGINRMKAPVHNAVKALVIHVIVLVALLAFTNLGIYAVIWSNTVFAFFMCLFNAMSLRRYAKYRQEIQKTFVIPGISAVIMGILVTILYHIFVIFAGNAIATILSICFGAFIYLVLLLALKGLNEEEIRSMPKGTMLLRLLKKLHLL
ncbi:MAG: polysaccharide biosynthesis C-terminal domain-containing protein [Lachnospiraceae bacterium]